MTAKLLPYGKLSAQEHRSLREQLDKFYGAATEYTSFQATSDQRNCWDHVVAAIESRRRAGCPRVRVLEIGAGRSGFGRYLHERGLRNIVDFHAHDVTRYNEEWLRAEADECFFGDISSAPIAARYDIIFSTYVLEHVTDPPAHLEKLWSLLAQPDRGGEMFVFAPSYAFPGYVNPAARHLPATLRFGFAIRALWARLIAFCSGEPQFLIQTDLAAFHTPFFLDADAVHWVSSYDLFVWAKRRKASCRRLLVGAPAFPSKDWVIKRLCTTAVHISR